MTQEELQQQNEKLKQRLAKAIEVFKEQKENIERLTAERDKARLETKEAEERIEEFTKKLEEKSENDEKFFEQLNEIQELEKCTQKLKSDCEEAYTTIDAANQKIKKLEADKSNLDDSLQYEKIEHGKTAEKLENANQNIEELKIEIKGLHGEIAKRQERIDNFVVEINETKNQINELNGDYQVLQEKNSSLLQQVEEQAEIIDNLNKALDNLDKKMSEERKSFQEWHGKLLDKEEELREMLTTAKA